MYNLTYLGHLVTLPWLDLRSNFDLDLSRSNYTWFDAAPWRDKHDSIKIVALPLKLKILSSKNRFENFGIFTPGDLNFDLSKKWPKWFRNDFSRDFERRFLFCSTMRRSRDRQGGQTPPPIRWWKIQRPIRARINPRRHRDWGVDATPLRFFRNIFFYRSNVINFSIAYRTSFFHPSWKFSDPDRLNFDLWRHNWGHVGRKMRSVVHKHRRFASDVNVDM